MLRIAGIFSTISLLVVAMAVPRHRGIPMRLTSEAYVWQSTARAETRDAMATAADLDCLHILAAEVAWRDKQLVVATMPVDPAIHPPARTGRVIRLGQSTASLIWTDERVAILAGAARTLAASRPREIQIDYDCPASRLGGYRKLLDNMQAVVPDVPVVFTALPSWLDAPGFAALARAHPGYILQVHSLDLPSSAGAPVVLCDPAAARRAVARAAMHGVPFRLALPTYGSEILFDANGRVVDVVSEDRPSSKAARAVTRQQVMADAPALARLVAELLRAHPPALTGLVWYRLPVATDRRNWPWQTFDAVRQGKPVAPHLEISFATTGTGSHDIVLANTGTAPARLPAAIALPPGTTAADAARPYRVADDAARLILAPDDLSWRWLQAGERRTIGWIRHPAPPPSLAVPESK